MDEDVQGGEIFATICTASDSLFEGKPDISGPVSMFPENMFPVIDQCFSLLECLVDYFLICNSTPEVPMSPLCNMVLVCSC